MTSDEQRGGAHSEPEPFEAELERLYSARFPKLEREMKAKLWRTLCDAFFSRYVPRDGVVVDLGAGYCDFINHVTARRRIAVDLNPDARRFAAEGVEVLSLPIAQVAEVLEPGSVDLVFASNVFEHMRSPEALLTVLRAVREVLRPGGRLVVMQPNVRLLGGAFWNFFDHTLPLTELGMAEALEVVGLDVVECRARFLPYTTKSRLPKWDFLVRLYLRLPPAQFVFGKQMLVVAERPR